MVLAVEDGDFGLRADALQLGAGLNGHRLAKARCDGAGFLDDSDNGGAIIDANDTATLSGVLNEVANAEGVSVGHNKVEVGQGADWPRPAGLTHAATASGVLALALRRTRAG